jgi:acetyltransferase-like isoleucine patch superfamily enzyme
VIQDQEANIGDLWYVPPKPLLPRGWLVYSLDFVLAAIQGRAADPHAVRHSAGWLAFGTLVRAGMAVAQAIIMILAWIPGISWLLETTVRVFTRNAIGFFLRACYWKAKLQHLGQDTVIDQYVDIWGPSSISIGSRCHVDTYVRLAAGERGYGQHGSIRIGDFVHLGPGVHIAGRGGVEIRDYVGISANAHLYSATGVVELPSDPGQLASMSHMAPTDQQSVVEAPVVVEEYAFVGIMARIMPGTTIGRGAIVHACTEVTRSIPPFANYGGIPRGKQVGWRKPRRSSPKLGATVANASRTESRPSARVPEGEGDPGVPSG